MHYNLPCREAVGDKDAAGLCNGLVYTSQHGEATILPPLKFNDHLYRKTRLYDVDNGRDRSEHGSS